MAWKGVHISRPARLSYRDRQLIVSQDGGEVVMPVEDVAWIVLDNSQVSLTATLVSACMDAGVAIVFSDERHLPSGLALPFHRHHRQASIVQLQLGASQPLKKRLWQALVTTKIDNQTACLIACGRPSAPVAAMARLVASGDPENIEARAARGYWSLLFSGFTRAAEDDLRNKMLNYGYAVVRAGIARALVAHGFLPCIGLFHASAANAFNLADDVFEPFRPVVDRKVFEMSGNGADAAGELTVQHRRNLAGLLGADIQSGGEIVSVLTAADRACASLARAMEASSPALLCLPRL
jgi:CRISPR-associated protein Cas1